MTAVELLADAADVFELASREGTVLSSDVANQLALRAKRIREFLAAELAGAKSDQEECDQCGAKRQAWQQRQENRCPNHANPYGPCDGLLRPFAPPAAAEHAADQPHE